MYNILITIQLSFLNLNNIIFSWRGKCEEGEYKEQQYYGANGSSEVNETKKEQKV